MILHTQHRHNDARRTMLSQNLATPTPSPAPAKKSLSVQAVKMQKGEGSQFANYAKIADHITRLCIDS